MIQKTPFVIEIKNSREQNVDGCSFVSNERLREQVSSVGGPGQPLKGAEHPARVSVS
jgi:hypothetical protein